MDPRLKPAGDCRFWLATGNFNARTVIRVQLSRPFLRRAPRSMPTARSRAMPACSAKLDQARDMMMRGAFAETLSARGIRRVPMLFQHDPSEPVGIWLELREDHRGLFARGRLIPEVARGRELLSLLTGRGDRRSVDRLPHVKSAHRSQDPHPPDLRGRPLGNFHRHVSDADGRARARGEAFTRAQARRAGMDAYARHVRWQSAGPSAQPPACQERIIQAYGPAAARQPAWPTWRVCGILTGIRGMPPWRRNAPVSI